jgi:DNA-binding transcriptional LysR family regulator
LTALEAKLGVRLADRSSRRFRLTDEGLLLYERSRSILEQIRDAEAEVASRGGAARGLLKVGAPSDFGRRHLGPILALFTAQHPGVEAHLVLSDAGLENQADGCDADFGEFFSTYAGPRHLAALLLATDDGIHDAVLTKLPPPTGADQEIWKKWLQHRAAMAPFVWPNHREAIARGFHWTGKSAVVILPTGAGKTTLSSLKIAGNLARKKKVIFLAPTHSLVEH